MNVALASSGLRHSGRAPWRAIRNPGDRMGLRLPLGSGFDAMRRPGMTELKFYIAALCIGGA